MTSNPVSRVSLGGCSSLGELGEVVDADAVVAQGLGEGVVLLAGPLGPGTEDQPCHVDHGQDDPERGEVDVGVVRGRQHRFAGDDGGEQEQHGQEGVAVEDVAHGELVVAQLR
ncbi:hypothetical protein [Streptomyces sp. NPDC007206]|uniref:hypothetical protein n=1 Tax=Streptomyces sp. NPDC007206 TaxID=3154317 RepID=UPI0033CC2167